MADPSVSCVVVLRIDAIQLPHTLGQGRIRCFDQQMVMIAHQAIGMTVPPKLWYAVGEHIQKLGPVLIIPVNGPALIASTGDVVKRAGKLYTQRPRHLRTSLSLKTASLISTPINLAKPYLEPQSVKWET
jgi:hypothetical protein